MHVLVKQPDQGGNQHTNWQRGNPPTCCERRGFSKGSSTMKSSDARWRIQFAAAERRGRLDSVWTCSSCSAGGSAMSCWAACSPAGGSTCCCSEAGSCPSASAKAVLPGCSSCCCLTSRCCWSAGWRPCRPASAPAFCCSEPGAAPCCSLSPTLGSVMGEASSGCGCSCCSPCGCSCCSPSSCSSCSPSGCALPSGASAGMEQKRIGSSASRHSCI